LTLTPKLPLLLLVRRRKQLATQVRQRPRLQQLQLVRQYQPPFLPLATHRQPPAESRAKLEENRLKQSGNPVPALKLAAEDVRRYL
jgi:hypothetical protein